MSKDEKCTCKACKNTVFHCQICKVVGFSLPSSSWLLKLSIIGHHSESITIFMQFGSYGYQNATNLSKEALTGLQSTITITNTFLYFVISISFIIIIIIIALEGFEMMQTDRSIVSDDSSSKKMNNCSVKNPQPDSCWSWVVCVACSISNTIIVGIIISYGIIFPTLLEEFQEGKAITGVFEPAFL